MTSPMEPRTILAGLRFPECPRWRDGALYFSDQHDGTVWRVTPQGESTAVARAPNHPSGLGWLPDGTLCVVSMLDRKLLRITARGPETLADLSSFTPYPINDMVIDRAGRMYVGNFGFDLLAGDPPRATFLLCVDASGGARTVADNLQFPNGTVITPDGDTLIIAESFGACLTAFSIGADGSLTNRRLFASLNGVLPDGICLDEEMGVWVSCPFGEETIRVMEGGEVTDRIAHSGRHSYACMLGGEDRRDLYICTATSFDPEETTQRMGKIEVVELQVAGAGLP